MEVIVNKHWSRAVQRTGEEEHVGQAKIGSTHKTFTGSSQMGSSTKSEKRTQAPTLTKKLSATDNYWQRKSVFSNTASTGLYQPQSRAGTKPRSRWPTQNRLHGCLVSFFLFVCFFNLNSGLVICFKFCFCFVLWLLRERETEPDRERQRQRQNQEGWWA